MFTYYGKIVIKTIKAYQEMYPKTEIMVGGVFASLMPDYVEQKTGIKPHVGLLEIVEPFKPDYSLFPKQHKCVVFTSRGCIRKCKFCAVKSLEQFKLNENWKQEIRKHERYTLIDIQDNNFTATPFEHQTAVVKYLAKLKKNVDFRSGLDCFLFKAKHAKLYSQLKIPTIRFAFDGMYQDGHIQPAIELALKTLAKDCTVYTLFNFNDDAQEFYYRSSELVRVGANVYPMQYSPLDRVDQDFIGDKWSRIMLSNFDKLLRAFSNGRMQIFGRGSADRFKKFFGASGDEFYDIIRNNDKLIARVKMDEDKGFKVKNLVEKD